MIKLSEIISKEEMEPQDDWIIISYMIMSEEVIQYVFSKYKNGQIKTKFFNKYFQIIFRWLIKYYGKYNGAPKQTIKDMFYFYSKIMNTETKEILEDYLERLSSEYVTSQESGLNYDFVKKEILPKFIKKMSAALLIEEIQEKIKSDKLEDIDFLVQGYKQITDEEEDINLGTVKPGSIRSVKKYYGEEKEKGFLFRLSGTIGDFIGNIYRGKLISIAGVEKSGKTYLMQEIGYQAMLHHKLRILDINLEMQIEDMEERFWQRIGNFILEGGEKEELPFPIFDCANNQFGCCEVKKSENKKQLIFGPEDKISFFDRRNWIVCQDCRGKQLKSNTPKTKRFIPAIWFKKNKFRKMNEERVLKVIKKNLPYGISNYRIKCFPRFSATLDDIIQYINTYRIKKNFKPDILLIDYPDIMQPIQGNLMDRFNIDYNWKKCAGLAQELDCCVIVADQAIKTAREKRSIGPMDTSESKTKDAHIDLKLTLNKTEEEINLGLARLGMLFRRKGKRYGNEIMLTQRISTGNPILDSEFWSENKSFYNVSLNK